MDDLHPLSETRGGTLLAAGSQRQPVLLMRHGRGRTGGSTVLDLLIQIARSERRKVLIGDGDRRNPTLAALYPPNSPGAATQPPTDEIPDVKDWITGCIGQAVEQKASLVLDLGGGDRIMQEYGRDLALIEFCESAGILPVSLYFSGPDREDFEHILAIWHAGYFNTPQSVLIFNEHLVPQGRTPAGAFEIITKTPEMAALMDAGLEVMYLPRLPCMPELRRAGISFLDAAANRRGGDGKTLDPIRQFMVASWVKKICAAFQEIGADEWLP